MRGIGPGLQALPPSSGLPRLPDAEFVLAVNKERCSEAVCELADMILDTAQRPVPIRRAERKSAARARVVRKRTTVV